MTVRAAVRHFYRYPAMPTFEPFPFDLIQLVPPPSRISLEKLGWRKFLTKRAIASFMPIAFGLLMGFLYNTMLTPYPTLLSICFWVGLLSVVCGLVVLFQTVIFTLVRAGEILFGSK